MQNKTELSPEKTADRCCTELGKLTAFEIIPIKMICAVTVDFFDEAAKFAKICC